MPGKLSSTIEITAATLFALAILHTFLTKHLLNFSHRFRRGSWRSRIFHVLGEVELVFAFWSLILMTLMAAFEGGATSLHYLKTRNFTEPVFVIVIVVICGTRPILDFAELLIGQAARLLPVARPVGFFATALSLGPILGSLITEPAAMTVTALLLNKYYFQKSVSQAFKYSTLGTLFVNVSIGGTLTPFAAPPILMVAGPWDWDLVTMLTRFGWKGALACAISTAIVTLRFRRELSALTVEHDKSSPVAPAWRQIVNLSALAAVVISAHHIEWLIGLFVIFFITSSALKERLLLKSGLLVGLFLAGLVVLGGLQGWWLSPILAGLGDLTLYLGAMALTAITDNAALTYLGSLIPELTESARYSLVAGAVVGGGLTVIANAPNPAGYGILSPSFGEDGASPLGLFKAALVPTAIAAALFWFF